MKRDLLSVMKKVMMVALLLTGGGTFCYGSPVQVPMHIIDQSSGSSGPTYAPIRPWYITQDDYTLELLDEDGVVVYTTFVPSGTTTVILPSTLSGDFELRLVADTYYYRGYICL